MPTEREREREILMRRAFDRKAYYKISFIIIVESKETAVSWMYLVICVYCDLLVFVMRCHSTIDTVLR